MLRKYRGLAVVLAALCLLTACSNIDPATGKAAGGKHEVRFVQQPWEDLVVETQIARNILDKMGYTTSTKEVSVPLAAQALATGQADAYLGNWWPSQKPAFEQFIQQDKIKVMGTLLTGTTYAPVVPAYVTDQLGVRSLADLAKNGDKFHKQILGIEPGTPGNQYILDAIKANAYGLGDWTLVQSSTEAMLAEVTRRAEKQEPVVFLGWAPHWMTVQWKLNFLDDPEKVWPGAGEIRSLARSGLATNDPNLARLLSQIKLDMPTVSQWIFDYGKQRKSAEEIARAWMVGHQDVVRQWLEGVTTAGGKPAAPAVLDGLG
jgi:glycine betaine/proline transport system substrate-binding protein